MGPKALIESSYNKHLWLLPSNPVPGPASHRGGPLCETPVPKLPLTMHAGTHSPYINTDFAPSGPGIVTETKTEETVSCCQGACMRNKPIHSQFKDKAACGNLPELHGGRRQSSPPQPCPLPSQMLSCDLGFQGQIGFQ